MDDVLRNDSAILQRDLMSSRSLLSISNVELDHLLLFKDRMSGEAILRINLSSVDEVISRLLTNSGKETESLTMSCLARFLP